MTEIEFRLEVESKAGRSKRFHLTPTELEMLQLLASGRSQKEIAAHYGKNWHWVGNAFDRMRNKMHAKTSYQMITIGFVEDLLKMEDFRPE